MNKEIEVIADNAGGITIQNIETKAVAFFEDIEAARGNLHMILACDDMSDWELSGPDYYITDEQFEAHESSGGYEIWDAEKIWEELQD